MVLIEDIGILRTEVSEITIWGLYQNRLISFIWREERQIRRQIWTLRIHYRRPNYISRFHNPRNILGVINFHRIEMTILTISLMITFPNIGRAGMIVILCIIIIEVRGLPFRVILWHFFQIEFYYYNKSWIGRAYKYWIKYLRKNILKSYWSTLLASLKRP